MRFADSIIGGADLYFPDWGLRDPNQNDIDEMQELVATSPIIEIDNVAQYLAANSKETINLVEDCPNIAPPFNSFWFEWNSLPWITAEKNASVFTIGTNIAAIKMGLSCQVYSHEKMLATYGRTESGKRHIKHSEGCRWFLDLRVFQQESKKRYWDFRWHCNASIRDNGSLIGFHEVLEGTPHEGVEIYKAWLRLQTFIGFLAISFMHCKNVAITPIEASRNEQRMRKMRNKKPFLRRHVLDIDPMKRILASEGEGESKGLKHALHICRGHFHEYGTNGRGLLFGKYTGSFWIPQTVRGSGRHGTVTKDYKVSPPTEEGT